MAKKLTKAAERQIHNRAIKVFGNLNELSVEAKQWETDFYNPTMDKLYGLLSKALAEVRTIRNDENNTTLAKAFEQVVKDKGITCTNATSLELQVVRVVFGIDDATKRASRYATVLKIAYKQDVTPEVFVDWVKGSGGIDEIRRASSSTAKKDYVAIAESYYDANTAMPDIELVNAKLTKIDKSDFALLVVRKNKDGSFTAVNEVPNINILNSALTYLGKEVDKKETDATVQSDKDTRLAKAVEAVAKAEAELEVAMVA